MNEELIARDNEVHVQIAAQHFHRVDRRLLPDGRLVGSELGSARVTLVLYRRRVFAEVKAEMRGFGSRSIKH
jgi:hypothetical protein